MIDFTNCKQNKFKAYGGGNGNKICVIYEDENYMLKFPPKAGGNMNESYTNACLSEYLACHIYQSIGIKTQETLLGKYSLKGREFKVVACKDFTGNGDILLEFAKLKNACIDSSQNGYGIELESVISSIEEQKLIQSNKLKEFFWDMFIVDAFVGNFDRHNGNWGIIVNEAKQTAKIAPVYDCGSCLYPQLSVNDMEKILTNRDEINQRVFTFPNSAVKVNNRKINYFEYISSGMNSDCTKALYRIFPRIKMWKIERIINDMPIISDVQKKFYTVMLKERHEKILEFSIKKLRQNERGL